jgi:2,4-dichlorophenol 6-monooxygenase
MCKNAIVVAQIGPRGNKAADVIDHDEQWERVKGLKRGGALLVRPDNFVAWRGNGVSRTGGAELVVAIQRLL